MIIPPKLQYCGLTIILDNPSRFDLDNKSLLTGFAGQWFNDECLQPEVTRYHCEIRTKEETIPWRDDTKCILALGPRTLAYCYANKFSLGEQRGSPFLHNGTPIIASYLPQDAIDPKDHEGNLNPLAYKQPEESANEDEEEATGKTHGKTSRSNWRFWLQKDTKKAIRIAREGISRRVTGHGFRPEYYPEINRINKLLSETSGQHLYLDIETDYSRNLLCVGFCFDAGNVFVVPVFRYNSGLAYDTISLCKFFRALSLAMQRNTVVAHNGFGFDYLVLAWRYKILVGRFYYDTMIAQHRCYPEVEKSLGHCISLWTDEPYHKAEGIIPPHNREQEEQLWSYNAKDVATTRLIKAQIDKHASSDAGLEASIRQGNSMIYSYLVTSLLGVSFDQVARAKVIENNDKMMTQYLRMMRLLIGRDFLPTSNKQCTEYFHETLGYDVLNRSPKTKAPSWGEKVIQKLKLKHPENPVLDLCLLYRAVKKETGSFGFIPWKE